MTLLILVLPLLGPADEDSFTVTLAFERIHCEECKAELEASLRKMAGIRQVTFVQGQVVATFDEKARVPAFNRLPKDMSLKTITVAIRGTANVAGDRVTLVARSGTTHALVNPEGSKKDLVGELRKKPGGKGRYRVTGTIGADGRSIALQSIEATDWKD